MNKSLTYYIQVSLALFFYLSLSSCSTKYTHTNPKTLSHIQIIDRNGFSETITTKSRLKQFEKMDFLASLPYKKVSRKYGQDAQGNIRGYITSYHPNGQLYQYLETLNSRAQGSYREWYGNGKIKITATILGGLADLTTLAHESWLFNGLSQAYDEDGKITATIHYSKGELEGLSTYYHKNGNIWKLIPYHKNSIHGSLKIFTSDKVLLHITQYSHGLLHGLSQRFWSQNLLASEETYKHNFLESGKYYNIEKKLIAEVNKGNGQRVIFGKYAPVEYHTYKNGKPEGAVKIFDEHEKFLLKAYHIKNAMKNGEEIEYYLHSHQAKISINWHNDTIQGTVKTWYSTGKLESQREMNQNKKHGLLTSWYADGSLMLIEEYDHNLLVKGDYFRQGESKPISRIINGEGVSTLYNSTGQFLKRISYQDGKPSH